MNNLKRVLSLALASVMVIGMMVTGASAFTDDADIENKEAVGTMTALNIIDGMPDGSFDPDGLLLREQAAKMVFVALNGGQKNDNLTTKEVGTFSDVKKGNWAEGYIEWCYNRGIIAGIGGGLFNPKGNLTGTQLAKIMLVAIGYNAKTEGLEGTNDWALNVNALALNKGFYKNLGGIDPEANITRDQAALLILNACNAEMVKYEYQIAANNGQISTVATAVDIKNTNNGVSTTILSESYDAQSYTGVLQGYVYNTTDKTFSYQIENGNTMNGVTDYVFKSDVDYTAFLGQKVKVLCKDGYAGANENEVYGITDVTPLIVTTTVGETTVTNDGATPAVDVVKAGGKTYYLDSAAHATTKVWESKASRVSTYNVDTVKANYNEPSTLKLVDVDGDNEIDWAIVTPVLVKEVTYVSSTTVTATSNYKFADDDIYAGVAKGDWVVIVPAAYNYAGKNVITKATTVEGKVDRTRGATNTDLQIDGKWYSKATIATGDSAIVGDEVKLVVVGSYYYNTKVEVTAVTDLLFVADAANASLGAKQTVVYFTDGSKRTVNVTSVNGTTGNDNLESGVTAGKLYTYTEDKGEYALTAVGLSNTAGYDLAGTAANVAYSSSAGSTIYADSANTYRILDDTVVFVEKLDTKTVKVLTGKAVKEWEDDYGDGNGVVLGELVNGFATAKVAAITHADDAIPGAAGDDSFGYVVSAKATLSTENDKYYMNFQIFNGTSVVDVKEQVAKDGTHDDTTQNKYKQGHYVTYKDMGNGIVKDTAEVATAGNLVWDSYAITALENKDIELSSTGVKDTTAVYKLTTDTVIIGVDTEKKAGVEGAALAIAAETATPGTYQKNVWALINKTGGTDNDALDAGDKVVLIFIDAAGLQDLS